jgi:hypothetical protein
MQAGDPRADPVVVDLIELAGLWLAAGDYPALSRTLQRLDAELSARFAADGDFAERFRELVPLVERAASAAAADAPETAELRRAYRQAIVG